MKKLNKVFTVASTFSHDEDGASNLLFSVLGEDYIYNRETMDAIVNDPLFQKIMGQGGVLVRIDNKNTPTILATPQVEKYAVRRMEQAGKDERILVFHPKEGIKTIDLYETYFNCTLPHKVIIGCVDCLTKDTGRPCEIKRLDEDFGEEGGLSPHEVTQELKSRKDTVGGFTYVSPRLTSPDPISRTFRETAYHDFTEIEYNSEKASKGLKERWRRKRFGEEVCPQCLIREACKNTYYNWPRKYCTGPYAYTQAKAIKKVVDDTRIPFTNKQLLFLALNSGRLDKRYNRCKYWVTFRSQWDRGLRFGLCRYATGHFEAFDSFEEAEEVIRSCINRPAEIDEYKPLTRLEKAVLIELSKRNQSPVNVSRWHRTYYDVLGIEYLPHAHKFELYYKFNGRSGWSNTGEDPMVLPWYVTAANFHDIFKEYGDLAKLEQIDHKENYGKFHYGRTNRY